MKNFEHRNRCSNCSKEWSLGLCYCEECYRTNEIKDISKVTLTAKEIHMVLDFHLAHYVNETKKRPIGVNLLDFLEWSYQKSKNGYQ